VELPLSAGDSGGQPDHLERQQMLQLSPGEIDQCFAHTCNTFFLARTLGKQIPLPTFVSSRLSRRHRQRHDPTQHRSEPPRVRMSTRMFHQPSSGFHQPLLQTRQRVPLDWPGQRQSPPQIAQVGDQEAQRQRYLVGAETVTGKTSHLDRLQLCMILSFSNISGFDRLDLSLAGITLQLCSYRNESQEMEGVRIQVHVQS